MPSVIITGANRGLGLEFARQYAADGWRVFACCREPQEAQGLRVLAERHENLSVHGVDVVDHKQRLCRHFLRNLLGHPSPQKE